MKVFINLTLTLAVILGFGLIISPCFAASKDDTIITYLVINGDKYFEIEIIPEKNGNVFLPVKRFAAILEIPVKTNHSSKEISFASPGGKDVRVTKENTFFDGKKINASTNDYLQLGIMESSKDEIYCEIPVLAKIFEVDLSVDKSDFTTSIKTKRKLSYYKNIATEEDDFDQTLFKAYSEVLVPVSKGKVTFDTLEFNNLMNTDSTRQVFLSSTNTNAIFNNNTQFSLKGTAYKGDYAIDFNTNNYTDKAFSFGGMGFRYKNKTKKGYDYELGRVSGFRDDFYSIATDILGAQIYNYEVKPGSYTDIEGKVKDSSVVNVYFDDEFHSTLSTYAGNYSLKDIQLQHEPYRIKIEEINEDNSVGEVIVKEFPKKEQKTKYSLLAGLSGINGKLFSQEGQLYQMNSKKFVVGFESKRDLSEKFTTDTKILFDRIVTKNAENIWGQSYYSNNSILSGGTFQNPNNLEGLTVINTLNYDINDKVELKATIATSGSVDTATGEDKNGYNAWVDCEYKEEKYSVRGSIYQQSPKFYLAGGDSGFVSDRIGANIGGRYTNDIFNVDALYSKYSSNLENINGVGVTGFDEFSFGANAKVSNILNVKLNGNVKTGENLAGKNESYYYDLNVSKNFKKKLNLELGKRESNYETIFFNGYGRGFNSLHSTIYAKGVLKMPRNKGSLILGHEAVNYQSNGTNNDYDMYKIGYIFPEYKRFILSAELGHKYRGADKGNNCTASLGYRTRSGSIISLNYQYGKDNGYLFDNMYIPSNIRHSFSVTFNDTLAIMPNGIKSVGYSDESKGFAEIVAYFDKNKNNKFDNGDLPIANVPVKTTWTSEILYTDSKGICPIEALDKGVYKVEIDSENLKTNLTSAKTTKESQIILISPKKTTQVAFAMTSSVGNISGNLKIVDDFGRKKNISDFIVVLHDENDNEAAYSTVDKLGNYAFSGVEPGKYTLKLDESFLNEHSLSSNDAQGTLDINIPYTYKKFIDIKNADLVYRSW